MAFEHVINELARLIAAPRSDHLVSVLQVLTPPIADTGRYDCLRDLHDIKEVGPDVIAELKALRLHGMAGT